MAIDSSGRIAGQSQVTPVRLLEESGALLFGEFTLSSGKKSDYYFDSKKLTLDPAGARFVARQLVDRLDAENIRYVGGVAYGAIPIVSHVVMLTGLREDKPIRAFYHRKDSKEHGTGAAAEGQFPPQGEPVAIVEDVVTTGGSLLQSIRHAEDSGYNVTHALTLIDRDEGGREAIEAAGYKFWSLFRVELTEGKPRFIFNGG
ncbi:MAG: orotate phosphoribosyltransferase [Chloroflexi bacterium]|nr:orotate phosphoribosyltransferase [Chloroflexota bacterium]MYE38730.1 orotate phosphoribosyltransferase [Chloroflexota bacterium]